MRGVRSFTAMWASGSSKQISRNYCGRPQATKPVGADPDLSSARPSARGDLTPGDNQRNGTFHAHDRLGLVNRGGVSFSLPDPSAIVPAFHASRGPACPPNLSEPVASGLSRRLRPPEGDDSFSQKPIAAVTETAPAANNQG